MTWGGTLVHHPLKNRYKNQKLFYHSLACGGALVHHHEKIDKTALNQKIKNQAAPKTVVDMQKEEFPSLLPATNTQYKSINTLQNHNTNNQLILINLRSTQLLHYVHPVMSLLLSFSISLAIIPLYITILVRTSSLLFTPSGFCSSSSAIADMPSSSSRALCGSPFVVLDVVAVLLSRALRFCVSVALNTQTETAKQKEAGCWQCIILVSRGGGGGSWCRENKTNTKRQNRGELQMQSRQTYIPEPDGG